MPYAGRRRTARGLTLLPLLAGACATAGPRPAAAPAPAPAPAPSAPTAALAEATRPADAMTLPRTDRWEVRLNSGAYLYELRLTGLRGDSLLAVLPAGPLAVPLADVDELRLVQASIKSVGGSPRNTFGGLVGADDAAYKLSKFGPAERLAIVTELLRAREASRGTEP